MMSLLFDKNFFIGVGSVVVIFLLIWLCVKFPSARLACIMIFSLGFAGLTAYCVVNLNVYYTASGGIYGEITGLFAPSVSVEETSIHFDNLELIQYLDTDTYYCKIITDKVIDVDNEKKYQVYVNDVPCSNSQITEGYISCEYRYQFFDAKKNLLCDDTLQIQLVFNKNNSYFYVFTENGTTSVKYWNYYINKNNFVVSLKEASYTSSNDINFGDEITAPIYKVELQLSDELTQTQFYKEGEKLALPKLVAVERWFWEDGFEVVENGYSVNNDMVIKPEFVTFDRYMNECAVCELENGFLIGSSRADTFGLAYYNSSSQSYMIVSTEGYGWNGCSSYVGGAASLSSIYSEVKEIVFLEGTKQVITLDYDDTKPHALFADESVVKMVYANKNEKGIYLYDFLTETTTKIYDKEYWTNFNGKWNEMTGKGSSVSIKGTNETYYLEYDFVLGTFHEIQYPDDGDDIVGF
ncbi:MAG: hypothetical protein ACI4R8_03695 [Candidatus Caccovivens sp.]